jgi:hypothetical protein
MIEAARNDLFLLEKKNDEPTASKKPFLAEVDPNLLDKIQALRGKRRTEALADMRSAYLWLFSDNRALFQLVRDEDAIHVEVCIPFLVACEAVPVDAEILREKFRQDMLLCKLTPRMVKSGRFCRTGSTLDAGARLDRVFQLFASKTP